MGETELEGPHDYPLLAVREKEPEGADAAISSVPETTRPDATTTAEQGQPSARTLSGQVLPFPTSSYLLFITCKHIFSPNY